MDEGFSVSTSASHESFGAGPQTFPYVGFSFEPGSSWYVAGPEKDSPDGDEDGKQEVTIGPIIVYCGFKRFRTNELTIRGSADVYLNVKASGRDFEVSLSQTSEGDFSELLYEVVDGRVVTNHIRGVVVLPYYN